MKQHSMTNQAHQRQHRYNVFPAHAEEDGGSVSRHVFNDVNNSITTWNKNVKFWCCFQALWPVKSDYDYAVFEVHSSGYLYSIYKYIYKHMYSCVFSHQSTRPEPETLIKPWSSDRPWYSRNNPPAERCRVLPTTEKKKKVFKVVYKGELFHENLFLLTSVTSSRCKRKKSEQTTRTKSSDLFGPRKCSGNTSVTEAMKHLTVTNWKPVKGGEKKKKRVQIAESTSFQKPNTPQKVL